ncbi:MAG: ABC transporter ATP-binding protein [Clostridia bacterium]|nr:ABC transporter ATP-binding protein [Clostridia bacterium]
MADTLLTVRGIRKTFGGATALDSLSFIVNKGEIFGFLGPSGAGKTTTIKLLTRQLRADEGEITLFGQEISSLPQRIYDDIGVLSDNSGLYERLTVQENLALFAELMRLPSGKIDEALEAVDLKDARKKPGKSLSRGMKQRLMLACVTMHSPKLLFLDEPTASLDPGTSMHIHRLLRKLNAEGTTIFLTTHNMEEADKLCNRVAFLNHGHIVACDTPDALKLTHARDEVVARLSGGSRLTVNKSAEGIRRLAEAIEHDPLLTLHSSEPNLEDIFLKLTGRELT